MSEEAKVWAILAAIIALVICGVTACSIVNLVMEHDLALHNCAKAKP